MNKEVNGKNSNTELHKDESQIGKKAELTHERGTTPQLTGEMVQQMISDAVQKAVAAALAQIEPQLSTAPASVAPPKTALNPNPPPPPSTTPYKIKLKGIPVEPGQDLRHVHPQVIKNWFNSLENRWKESYNARKIDGQPASMSWTRG